MTQRSRLPGDQTEVISSISDEDLVCRVGSDRDKGAFTELFGRYAGRIKAFLIRSGAGQDEAEEATQEVMVSLWRRAETFNPAKAGAATWIYTIARNKRIDLVRRAQRPEPNAEDPLFRPEPIESSEASLVGIDRDARIREAIVGLPDDQKAVIRLAFFTGLTHAEIATRLGAPLGTVKSRLRLSFAKLRDDLGSEFALELVDN
ncbi:MAG: sigma-70 family RNA polymerase sigma factor [Pseudomonadota bacterium]